MKKKSAARRPPLAEFLRHVLHDLRTPLTILKGEIGLALKKDRPSKEYRAVLASSMEEVDRISLIAENLSLLIKYESGAMPLRKKSVSINSLVEKAASGMKMPALRRKIRVNFLPEREMNLNCDENQISLLLQNLLGAAMKYTPAGGNIVLSLKKENGRAAARISGPDFAADEDISGARSGGGFALGLRVSRYIAEAHGGSIKIEKKKGAAPALAVFIPLSIPE